MSKQNFGNTMRVYHRYLGFFLAGIMAVYAISGVIMIFRNTDFLKSEKHFSKKLEANLTSDALGKQIKMRDLKFDKENDSIAVFKNGTYNKLTGEVNYSVKELPTVINKLTKLHKATTRDPLFYLNVFFGISLLFFVLSSFWMFLPKTTIFKKGMYYTAGGLILTIILLLL